MTATLTILTAGYVGNRVASTVTLLREGDTIVVVDPGMVADRRRILDPLRDLGVAPEQVHFHEVGALDAIVDVVGTCAALELLGVDEVRTSPVRVGLGTVTAAHGELPNPAPATLALLAAKGIGVEGVPTELELATPT